MTRTAGLSLAIIACFASLTAAQAQDYPTKAVHVVVPFPPGGGNDQYVRLVATSLSEAWGQPVVVENRPGASGMIGSAAVARATPDGYTLVAPSSSSHSIGPHLTRKPLYQPLRDFAPIIPIAYAPLILVVHPSLPAKSMKELVALARSRPGEIAYASSGTGTLQHLTAELFNLQAKINMLHVPYKGGTPAVTSIVGGHTSVAFHAFPTASGQLRAGRLRALAVTSAKRLPAAPEILTTSESGFPHFEAVQWWGMFAPAGTPTDIIGKINAKAGEILRSAAVRQRLAADAAEPGGGSADEFARFHKADYEKWGKVVRAAGVTLE